MLGIVVYVRYLICLNKSTLVTAAARLVVSLSGESLSPKYAPAITAPPTIPGGMPRAFPIPTNAIPTVADVVQLLPVATDIIEHITTQAGRKILGSSILSP